ncbi:unnamed protein product, partial [Durusdinium trenchii]
GEGATLTLKANYGPATRFPYVTPHFARVLVLRSNTPVGRSMAEFYLAVHDEVLKFLRGEARSDHFFSTINTMNETLGSLEDHQKSYFEDLAKKVVFEPLAASVQDDGAQVVPESPAINPDTIANI